MREVGEALVSGIPASDADGNAYFALVDMASFFTGPGTSSSEAAKMVRNSIKRAMGGFRGWWDMDPTVRLPWEDCYYCGASVWSEDGEHMAFSSWRAK